MPFLAKLFIAQLLAAAASCTDSECDAHGMLQVHVDNHSDGNRPDESGTADASAKAHGSAKSHGSGRPQGSGRKFTPNVWAPKFEAANGNSLQLECRGDGFAKCWTFFTAADPTHGYVEYVSQEEATELNLFKVQENGAVWMGSLVGQNQPVKAVRLQSKMLFSEGHIFVIDIQHLPTGKGTWPAWWSYGPDWPNNGEIDTIETVNVEDVVQQTLHTSYGCFMNIPRIFNPDCNSEDAHNGCGLNGPPNSGGPAFNNGGGGVFATKWTTSGIQMWMFPRGKIPADLAEDEPDPSTWGTPWAFFPFGANCPSTHFNDHVLVINLDFCGDWAGSVFPGGEKACEAFVTSPENIEKLQEAYWSINYVKVFAADASTKASNEVSNEVLQKVLQKGEKMKELKKERLARKEAIIKRRNESRNEMKKFGEKYVKAKASNEASNEVSNEVLQKVLQKGEKMKELKKERLARKEAIIKRRNESRNEMKKFGEKYVKAKA